MIESLTLIEALMIALSGATTVFMMLACLCVLIMVISKVVTAIEKKPEPATSVVEETTKVEVIQNKEEVVVAKKEHTGLTYGDEIILIDVNEKTAACIMAIVAEETGLSLNELVFKKIRAL